MTGDTNLAAVLENSPIGVSISRRRDGRIIFANTTFTKLIGLPPEKLIGTHARDHYADAAQRAAILARVKDEGRVEHAEVQFLRADGTPFWTLLTILPSVFDGEEVNLAWIYDITDRKIAEDKLQLAAKVVETASEGILITDSAGIIEAVNTAFTLITGYVPNEVIGRTPSMLASGHHDSLFYGDMWRSITETGKWQGEVWNRRKTGEIFVEWLSIASVRDVNSAVSHMIGIFTDITSRKEGEQQNWQRANFDALTELPNRALFMDRLSQAARSAARDGSSFALLFIDLDGFKAVNDTHGHAAGDALLQEVAARLSSSIRSSDTVARLSGDEFTVILQTVNGRSEAGAVAGKMVARLAEPILLDGLELGIHASIGIALFPDDDLEPAQLIHLADQAMYAAKRSGKNRYHFHNGPASS